MPRAKKAKKKSSARPPGEPAARVLNYKVIELSNVDEATLERTVNEWVRSGWSFDGVQFAMRESSKRPAMAFVFFTRKSDEAEASRPASVAEAHLRRLVLGPAQSQAPRQRSTHDAWARLAELADVAKPAGSDDGDES